MGCLGVAAIWSSSAVFDVFGESVDCVGDVDVWGWCVGGCFDDGAVAAVAVECDVCGVFALVDDVLDAGGDGCFVGWWVAVLGEVFDDGFGDGECEGADLLWLVRRSCRRLT